MKLTKGMLSKIDSLTNDVLSKKGKQEDKQMLSTFFRISNTDPEHMEDTISNMSMYKNKEGVIFGASNFNYPKTIYSKDGPQCHISATRLTGETAVKAAEEFWGIEFTWCEERGLCYVGLCARETREEMWHYSQYTDVYGWTLWEFEGEVVAPIPLCDGYIVKVHKTVNNESVKDFETDVLEEYGYVRSEIRDRDDELHWDLATECRLYWEAKGIESYNDKECREALY